MGRPVVGGELHGKIVLATDLQQSGSCKRETVNRARASVAIHQVIGMRGEGKKILKFPQRITILCSSRLGS
jgi:hypothetical protein